MWPYVRLTRRMSQRIPTSPQLSGLEERLESRGPPVRVQKQLLGERLSRDRRALCNPTRNPGGLESTRGPRQVRPRRMRVGCSGLAYDGPGLETCGLATHGRRRAGVPPHASHARGFRRPASRTNEAPTFEPKDMQQSRSTRTQSQRPPRAGACEARGLPARSCQADLWTQGRLQAPRPGERTGAGRKAVLPGCLCIHTLAWDRAHVWPKVQTCAPGDQSFAPGGFT